jgi:hypothetical protein
MIKKRIENESIHMQTISNFGAFGVYDVQKNEYKQ